MIIHNVLDGRKPLLYYSPLYDRGMSEPCDRLKEARIRAGYDSASDAAKALGVTQSAYIHHENGTRGIPPKMAEFYAKRFKVTPQWLLWGIRDEPGLTLDQLKVIMREAVRSIPANLPIGEWPEALASKVYQQLDS